MEPAEPKTEKLTLATTLMISPLVELALVILMLTVPMMAAVYEV